MRNYRELEYLGQFNEAANIVKTWLDAKPDNKDLNILSEALITIASYNANLEIERRGFDKAYDIQRSELNKALEEIKRLKALVPTEAEKKFEAMTSGDNNAINSIL